MLQCPRCNAGLIRNDSAGGITFVCAECHGSMVAFSFLRKNFYSKDAINNLWCKALSACSSMLRCPYCMKPMKTVPVKENDKTFELNVCPACQQIWFDPGEIESLPEENTPEAVLKRAEKEQELYNYNKSLSASSEEQPEEPPAVDYYSPDPAAEKSNQEIFLDMFSGVGGYNHSQISLLDFLCFPEEQDVPKTAGLPVLTWLLVFVIMAVYTAGRLWFPELGDQWGFIPGQWERQDGMTLFTAPFLHHSVLQLLFCGYMLMVFADDVELYLGRVKFIILLLFSMLAGETARLIAIPSSPEVVLGMNARIAGLIAFYAIMFPNAKLCWLLRGDSLSSARWVRIYAPAVPVLFIVGQVLYAYLLARKEPLTASLYPLAGFIPGIVAAIICRIKNLERLTDKTIQIKDLQNDG